MKERKRQGKAPHSTTPTFLCHFICNKQSHSLCIRPSSYVTHIYTFTRYSMRLRCESDSTLRAFILQFGSVRILRSHKAYSLSNTTLQMPERVRISPTLSIHTRVQHNQNVKKAASPVCVLFFLFVLLSPAMFI